jgi:hypothetical protein
MTLQPKASITKSQISPLGELKGKVNNAPVVIGGDAYGPGSLRFNGFAGSLTKSTGLYDGVMRLEKIKPEASNESCEFSEIVAAIDGGIVTEDADV